MAKRELAGQRFERLLVLDFWRNTGRSIQWFCKCDCGKEIWAYTSNLTTGKSRSCGCISAERLSKMRRKHGKSETGAYTSWKGMLFRCLNSECKEYHNYGGRGIKVCERWSNERGFENFLEDMGERPNGKTIDRYPDINGNYEPSNCRWGTWAQQARGKRSNHNITYKGETHCLLDWAAILGLPYECLRSRFRKTFGNDRKNREWSIEEAFTTPHRFGIGNNGSKKKSYANL